MFTFQITDFRNLETFECTVNRGIQWLIGDNGAGKTAILESIYYLYRGRSFRERKLNRLIRHGRKQSNVSINFGDHRITMLLNASGSNRQDRFGDPISMTEVMTVLPVFYLGPSIGHLITGPPSYRRRLLDWVAFHVKRSHWRDLNRLKTALKQRNSLLRQQSPRAVIEAFDHSLITLSNDVSATRKHVVDLLRQQTIKLCSNDDECLHFEFRPGYSSDSLQETLETAIDTDLSRGYTTLGPHRADVSIGLTSQPKGHFSGGQTKMVAIETSLAALRAIGSVSNQPLLLIDDLDAELSAGNVELALDAIRTHSAYNLATTLGKIGSTQPTDTTFHVKRQSASTDIINPY